MLTHKAFCCTLESIGFSGFETNEHDRHVSFLPLSHAFERILCWRLIQSGGEIMFFRGDILKLKDDWALFKPTMMGIVPRLIIK